MFIPFVPFHILRIPGAQFYVPGPFYGSYLNCRMR